MKNKALSGFLCKPVGMSDASACFGSKYTLVKNLRKIKPTKDSAVYDYYLKKKSEGKKDKQAIVVAMNKIFFARVI